MSDIIDYLNWRGDISFSADPLNEVDFLILSWLSYVELDATVGAGFSVREACTLKDASDEFLRTHNLDKILAESYSFTKTSGLVLKEAAKTDRFKNLRLTYFVNEIDHEKQSQFAAYTALPVEKGIGTIVVFRGTDDNLVGWKEDFNMSFEAIVPSQEKALKYLENVAAKTRGNIYVCGHSKGGNLAIYASCMANEKIRKRIVSVFNFDGPGFGDASLVNLRKKEIKNKLHSFTPEWSIVGMLLHHEKNYTVVKSDETFIQQHDASSWQVNGKSFVTVKEVVDFSKGFSDTLSNWLRALDDDERRSFVDTLFKILEANKAKTTIDINADRLKAAVGMIKEYSDLSKENKNMLKKILSLLFKEGSLTIKRSMKEKNAQKPAALPKPRPQHT